MWVNYYSNYLASFITCQWLGASSLFNKPIKNWLPKSLGQLCTGWQWWGERESHRHCQDSSWVRYKTNGSSFLMVSDETERNCSQQLFVPRNTRIWTQLSLTSDLREGIRVPLGQCRVFLPWGSDLHWWAAVPPASPIFIPHDRKAEMHKERRRLETSTNLCIAGPVYNKNNDPDWGINHRKAIENISQAGGGTRVSPAK